MSRLRVLKVLHGSPPDTMGGAGLVAGVLARALRKQGCDVLLAHPHGGGPTTWHGVPLHGARSRRALGFAGSWRGDPEAVDRLLDTTRPDVVHVHHLSGWPLDLPWRARARGARVVLTLHDYATVCARGQLVDRHLGPCAGPSIPSCTTCLAPYLGPGARWLDSPSKRDRKQVRQRLTTAAHALSAAHVRLAPSHHLARRFERMGAGRVHVHPIPLPAPVPAPRPPGTGPVRFLFCGSIIPTKGPHLLADAFRSVPEGDARLTIAGPSPRFPADPRYAERLRATVATSPGIELVGGVPHSAIPELLGRHDVLVVPSVWPENSPLIVREATAMGLRTILPVVGGAHELDPTAQCVQTTAPDAQTRLHTAILREIVRGRGRRTPLSWPSPEDCARALIEGWYRPNPTDPAHTD